MVIAIADFIQVHLVRHVCGELLCCCHALLRQLHLLTHAVFFLSPIELQHEEYTPTCWVQDAWEQQEWSSHIPRLAAALQADESRVTGRHVDAMWHLCQQEAGLWGITNQACSLFPPQVSLQMHS